MYTEQLMKPVFHTNKRSYSHIVGSPPESPTPDRGTKPTSLSGMIGKSTDNSIEAASPHNEYLGETASKLQINLNEEDANQRVSHLTAKNETF